MLPSGRPTRSNRGGLQISKLTAERRPFGIEVTDNLVRPVMIWVPANTRRRLAVATHSPAENSPLLPALPSNNPTTGDVQILNRGSSEFIHRHINNTVLVFLPEPMY